MANWVDSTPARELSEIETLYALKLLRKIQFYLQCISLLHIDMTQAFEIHPHVIEDPTYPT